MYTLKIAFMLLLLSILLHACAGAWEDIYTGTYLQKKYRIQIQETKGFSTNSFKWRIKYGNLEPLAIEPYTTDWGPPYSNDVFGANAFLYLGDSTSYNNIPFMPRDTGANYSMLYIPSKGPEDEVTSAWFDLLQHEWKNISAVFDKEAVRGASKLLGIVEGDRNSFVQDFKGIFKDKEMTLRIENDGRVRFMEDAKWANDEYSGLSLKVQMPGKKIYFQRKEGTLTPEILKNFKNKYGSDPLHYFAFEEGNVNSADMPKAVISDSLKKMICHKWHPVTATLKENKKALPPAEDGSYIWFKENKEFETKSGTAVTTCKWDYDPVDNWFVTYGGEEKDGGTHTLISVTDSTLQLSRYVHGTGTIITMYSKIEK